MERIIMALCTALIVTGLMLGLSSLIYLLGMLGPLGLIIGVFGLLTMLFYAIDL